MAALLFAALEATEDEGLLDPTTTIGREDRRAEEAGDVFAHVQTSTSCWTSFDEGEEASGLRVLDDAARVFLVDLVEGLSRRTEARQRDVDEGPNLLIVPGIDLNDLEPKGPRFGTEILGGLDGAGEDRLEFSEDEVPVCEPTHQRLVSERADLDQSLDPAVGIEPNETIQVVPSHGTVEPEPDGEVDPGSHTAKGHRASGDRLPLRSDLGEGAGGPALLSAGDFDWIQVIVLHVANDSTWPGAYSIFKSW